jgi:hypothetical protein
MTGLGGTGRIAGDLCLLAHDDVTGKPFLQVGLYGALGPAAAAEAAAHLRIHAPWWAWALPA